MRRRRRFHPTTSPLLHRKTRRRRRRRIDRPSPRKDPASPPGPRPNRRGHPTPVPAFAAVSAGAQHTLALSDRGELYAWGRNTEGQCGIARQKESRSLGWRTELLAESRPRRVGAIASKPRRKDGAAFAVHGALR